MCDYFGPTLVVQYGSVTNIIGSFITPAVSKYGGVYPMIIVRFLMGCGQGVLVPCMTVLIAHWFPKSEKSTAIAVATTGNQVIFPIFIFSLFLIFLSFCL